MLLFYLTSGNDTMSDASTNLGIGVFGVVLTVWILFANAALIISLLADEHRRRSVFCLHIVNLAVADLMVGVVVVPILADFLLRGSWELGEDVCQFWVISDILLCTVSITALVMVNCDRFMFLTCPGVFLESSRYIICCLMIMVPWLVGVALVLPLWILGKEHIGMHANNCFLVLREDYKISSLFVSFFVPAFLAIGVNIAILLMLFALRHRLDTLPLKRREQNPKSQILAVCVVSVVFIVMWAPFFVVSLLMSVIGYVPGKALLNFTIWMGYCNSGINPVLWMIYPPVRDGAKSLLCCCLAKAETPDTRVEEEEEEDESKRSMIGDIDDVFELKEANRT